MSADTRQTTLGGGRDDRDDLQGLSLFLFRQPKDRPLAEIGREARRRGLVGGGER